MSSKENPTGSNADSSELPVKSEKASPKKPSVHDIHFKDDGTLQLTPRTEPIDSPGGSKFVLVKY